MMVTLTKYKFSTNKKVLFGSYSVIFIDPRMLWNIVRNGMSFFVVVFL